MTQASVILGTAAYMSPEQARGGSVDRRADLWAFGAVLYEMLTGRRLFEGATVSDTLAFVLTREPDWAALPTATPEPVRRLLRRCLEKDRKRRMPHAAAARLEIEDALAAPADASVAVSTAGPAPSSRAARLAWPGVAVLALLALVSLAAIHFREVPGVAPLVRTEINTTGEAVLVMAGGDRDLAITPDGRHVVYRGRGQLLVRALDALAPTALTGLGEVPHGPFVSPDGRWVGFFDRGSPLKKVALTGGAAVTVTATDGAPSGATWLPDDTIVYATINPETGLWQVPAAGGEPTALTTPDAGRGEADHVWPEALPGGDGVLFTITATEGGLDAAQIAVLDLTARTQTVVVRGGHHAVYVPSGHLVYGSGGTLQAVPFDLQSRTVTGSAVPLVEDVAMTRYGAVEAAVSATGTLVYVRGAADNRTRRELVWVDRQGRETPIAAPPRAYQTPRLSPDGTRIAVYSADQENDLWVWDVARTTLTRVTFEPGPDVSPVWTPDGRRLVYASGSALDTLYEMAADGTGAAVRLTESAVSQIPSDVTPDGTQVIFMGATPNRGSDLRLLTRPEAGAAAAAAQVTALVETRFGEGGGVVSPDGHWLAYGANNSGEFEIYVRPFPSVGGELSQISTSGGTQAAWARDGREIYYRARDGAVMAVPVMATTDTWRAGTPTRLFSGTYYGAGPDQIGLGRQYDVGADGRFLMIKETAPASGAPTSLTLVLNWLEEVKRLVPRN